MLCACLTSKMQNKISIYGLTDCDEVKVGKHNEVGVTCTRELEQMCNSGMVATLRETSSAYPAAASKYEGLL
jgi:hypothetical protein